MLDKFGAVDGGDEESHFMARWASALVHGAMKFALKDGPVDFAQIGRGGFVLNTYHDAVRMKKISNRRTFTKEFRIRSHAKRGFAAAAIGGKRSLQFQPSARGHRAFFDHQLG